MKTKEKQIDLLARYAWRDGYPDSGYTAESSGIPIPRVFCKRGCKLLKTNDARTEKSAKREKERANV
jgi:hypothetical protein